MFTPANTKLQMQTLDSILSDINKPYIIMQRCSVCGWLNNILMRILYLYDITLCIYFPGRTIINHRFVEILQIIRIILLCPTWKVNTHDITF